MKNVLIEYTLKTGVDFEEIRPEVAKFVAGLREHSGGEYTSFRRGDSVRFAHVGRFPDKEKLAATQAMPFFGAFTSFLRERCAEGPTVTELSVVASTRDE